MWLLKKINGKYDSYFIKEKSKLYMQYNYQFFYKFVCLHSCFISKRSLFFEWRLLFDH